MKREGTTKSSGADKLFSVREEQTEAENYE
jgi:hypothetical protein